MKIHFLVNGKSCAVDVPGMKRLLDVLRLDLGLTGTKEGCGEGECGACTVLLDGAAVCACLVPIIQCQDREVLTIEGVANGNETLHPIQEALIEFGGTQCGICIPGMVMSAYSFCRERAVLRGVPPEEREIREALAGNLCRCTGYVKIVDAVTAACRHMQNHPRAET